MMWNLQSYPTTVMNKKMWNFRGQNILWTILHKEGAGWRPLNDPWSKPLLPLRPFPFPPSPSFTSHLSLFYPSCFPSIPFFPPSLFPLLPLVQLGGLGSAVGSSSGVRGGALAANTFWLLWLRKTRMVTTDLVILHAYWHDIEPISPCENSLPAGGSKSHWLVGWGGA